MTPQEVGRKVKEKYPQYKDLSDEEVGKRTIAKYPQYAKTETKPKSFLSKISESIKTRSSNVVQNTQRLKSGEITGPGYNLRNFGQIGGFMGDVAGATISGLAKTGFSKLPEQGQQNWKSIGSGISQSRPGQAALGTMQKGMEMYGGFKQRNPNTAEHVEALGNVLTALPVGMGGKIVAKEGVDIVKDTATIAKRMKSTNIDDAIEVGISKGIRPTVVGKNNLNQLTQYKERAKEAVLNIVKNKEGLSYVDEFGETVSGKLPSTLKELTEAVDQTKKKIFSQYSELAKKAGGTGVRIRLGGIADELAKLSDNQVMQDIAPEIIEYARKRGAALVQRGEYTAEQAQEAIKQLNASLESFYRNPTASDFSRLQVDALIVNNMRKSLDEAITGAVGEGYSELKRAYGALKTIEKDAVKRAVVEGRKNAKGLVDFTDIFSVGDIVMGVGNGNFAQAGKGVVQKAMASFMKLRNSPDNAIKQMFKKVDEAIKSEKGSFKPQSMTGKGLQSMKGKGGLSIQAVGSKADDPLLQEAKKYKSAEEFVKASIFSPARDSVARNTLRTEISKITEVRKADTLTPNPNNPSLDKSTINIKTEDITEGKRPYVLVDGDMIIDGHHAFEAYKKAGIEDIPVVTKSQLTDLWKKAQGETKRGFGTGAGRPKTITKAQDSKITKSSLQEVLQDGAREYIKILEKAKTIDFDAVQRYQDLLKRAPKITDIQSLTRNIAELERKSKLKLMEEAIKIRDEVFDGLRKKNLKK